MFIFFTIWMEIWKREIFFSRAFTELNFSTTFSGIQRQQIVKQMPLRSLPLASGQQTTEKCFRISWENLEKCFTILSDLRFDNYSSTFLVFPTLRALYLEHYIFRFEKWRCELGNSKIHLDIIYSTFIIIRDLHNTIHTSLFIYALHLW